MLLNFILRLDLETDHEPLNLGRALVDFADTDIAINSFDGSLAAMDLDASGDKLRPALPAGL